MPRMKKPRLVIDTRLVPVSLEASAIIAALHQRYDVVLCLVDEEFAADAEFVICSAANAPVHARVPVIVFGVSQLPRLEVESWPSIAAAFLGDDEPVAYLERVAARRRWFQAEASRHARAWASTTNWR